MVTWQFYKKRKQYYSPIWNILSPPSKTQDHNLYVLSFKQQKSSLAQNDVSRKNVIFLVDVMHIKQPTAIYILTEYKNNTSQ